MSERASVLPSGFAWKASELSAVGSERPRGAASWPRNVHEPAHALRQVESGIPKEEASQLFERIAAGCAQPVGRVRAQIIPDSSWKRSGERLRPSASQTVARLRRLLAIAENIWGNEADAMRWLATPHALLGDATPYSVLKTEAGGRAVEDILAAIEYGFSA